MCGGSVSSSDEFLPDDCDGASSSTSDDSTVKHPNKKARTIQDESFPPWVTGNDTPFMSTTSDLFRFVNAINSTSCCMVSKDCKGQLEPVRVALEKKGGTAKIEFACSKCCKRKVTFHTSSNNLTGIPNLSLSLRVACIAAGCQYATYEKIFMRYLGMHVVNQKQFYQTLEIMAPYVESILKEQCEEAKQEMKSMPQGDVGSWSRAVTVGDGVWLTRGSHSRNASYTVRNYITGALLYYTHMCQSGKDTVTSEPVFKGTSKSAEGIGASESFKKAHGEGMIIESHWQDGDSTSANALRQYYPDVYVFYCCGHIAKAHAKRLALLHRDKKFHSDAIKKNPNFEKLQCMCLTKSGNLRHGKNCGCFKEAFVDKARRNLVQILNNSGNSVAKFENDIRNLAKHHARNEHQWEVLSSNGEKIVEQCNFHAQKVCSCKEKCPVDNLSCAGKPYSTRNALTCPLHAEMYYYECDRLAQLAPRIIHPELGKGSTNTVESSHSVLIRFRSKDSNIKKLHYVVSTNLGLLQTNLKYMTERRGAGYHWIIELYEHMHIPVLGNLHSNARVYNENCKKLTEHRKDKDTIIKKKKALARHRGPEQIARREWGKKQKVVHDYRDVDTNCSNYRYTVTHSSEEESSHEESEAESSCEESEKELSCDESEKELSCDESLCDDTDDSCSDNSMVEGNDELSDVSFNDQFLMDYVKDLSRYTCLRRQLAHNPSSDDDNSNISVANVGLNADSQSSPEHGLDCDDKAVDDDSVHAPTGTEPYREPSVLGDFEPTEEWKARAIDYISQLSKQQLSLRQQRVNKLDNKDISPYIVEKILADGNCLFRAISKAVTGSEANHHALRHAICNFMCLDSNIEHVLPCIQPNFDSPKKYIEASKMRKDREWGSAVEISMVVAMLQITIFTSVVQNNKGGERRWVDFQPRFFNETCMTQCGKRPCIYLYHVLQPSEHYHLAHLP